MRIQEASRMTRQNSDLKWYHHTGDLANLLKAFVGTSFLSAPFAFKQSGLVVGNLRKYNYIVV